MGPYLQIAVLGTALLAWNLQPHYKQFKLAASNLNVDIDTHAWYYAGDANKTCEVIRPDILDRCEDGVFMSNKRFLITCDPGRKLWNPIMGLMVDPKPQGALWVMDYSGDNLEHIPVEITGLPEGRGFHPLGVEVYQGKTETTVFVANIDYAASVVDVFTMNDAPPYNARYQRTVESPNLHAPNSIVATSPTSFYASNDHRWSHRMHPWFAKLTFLENFLQFPLGWVSHVELLPNGKNKVTIAARWINFANGVAISADGKEFVVSSSITSILMFYDRNPKTNTLTFRESVPVPFPPDNLRYDSSGALLFAGNPNIPHFFQVAYGLRTHSPSWAAALKKRAKPGKVGEMPPDDQKAPFVKSSDRIPQHPKYEIESLYYSDGTQFTASATCLRDGDEIFATTLLGTGILHCKPNANFERR